MKISMSLLFITTFLAFPSSTLHAELPRLDLKKIAYAPTIDGVIEPGEWDGAQKIETFIQSEPLLNAAPTERTTVWMTFDQNNIYFAFKCFDSEPQKIIANQMQRDGTISNDDAVIVVMDPFGDNRNGYFFAVTAGGAKRDGLVSSTERSVNMDWDTLWHASTSLNEEGWEAEIAIPVKNISFNRNLKEWGINFQRSIRRKQESSNWSVETRNGFLDFQNAGKVSGIKNLSQGMGLTVKPFSTINLDLNSFVGSLHPGFDMAYKVTPSTTAVITFNTDFAEAETDEQQVNLSQFPLFFPEKRAFFLQDQSVFSFGGINQSPLPFYSRRIGIVRGQKKNILAGFKMSGREGDFNFGLLDVQMYNDADLGAKNLLVARASANFMEQSSAGIIVTHGDPSTTGQNTLVGADFKYSTLRLFENKKFNANAWAMGSFSGENGDDWATGMRLHYPNDDLSASLYLGRYGEKFRPALGFIEQPGVYEVAGNAAYRFRLNGFIRTIEVGAFNESYLGLYGGMKSNFGSLPYLRLESEYQDVLYVEHRLIQNQVETLFPIVPGVQISQGDYLYNQLGLSISSNKSRIVAGSINVKTGGFYGGRSTSIEGEIEVKPNSTILFSGIYKFTGASLPEGSFNIHEAKARVRLNFSPKISWSNLMQFDSITSNANLNSTARYEINSGQEAFLVLNQGIHIGDGFVLSATKGELSFKLGMTLAF